MSRLRSTFIRQDLDIAKPTDTLHLSAVRITRTHRVRRLIFIISDSLFIFYDFGITSLTNVHFLALPGHAFFLLRLEQMPSVLNNIKIILIYVLRLSTL